MRVALLWLTVVPRAASTGAAAAGERPVAPLRSLRAWLHADTLPWPRADSAAGAVLQLPLTEWRNSAPGGRGPDALVDGELRSPTVVAVSAGDDGAAPGAPHALLRFTAAADGATGSNLLLPLSTARARGLTIALLARPHAPPAPVGRLVSDPREPSWTVGTSDGVCDVVLGRLAPGAAAGGAAAAPPCAVTDTVAGRWVLYLLTATPPGRGSLYRNGALVATPANVSGFTQLRIGGGAGAFSSVDVLALAVYDAALSDGDRETLEGALAWRAGLEGAVLPSAHPHRHAAPDAGRVLPTT